MWTLLHFASWPLKNRRSIYFLNFCLISKSKSSTVTKLPEQWNWRGSMHMSQLSSPIRVLELWIKFNQNCLRKVMAQNWQEDFRRFLVFGENFNLSSTQKVSKFTNYWRRLVWENIFTNSEMFSAFNWSNENLKISAQKSGHEHAIVWTWTHESLDMNARAIVNSSNLVKAQNFGERRRMWIRTHGIL